MNPGIQRSVDDADRFVVVGVAPGRRLAIGPLERRGDTHLPARQRLVARFDMTLPEYQRKLLATEALGKLADEAGLSLIELVIAFVVNHPAVTCAIIGPRTMEQLDSQLPAADVTLDTDLLDRIDQIVRQASTSTPPTPATARGTTASHTAAVGAQRRRILRGTAAEVVEGSA